MYRLEVDGRTVERSENDEELNELRTDSYPDAETWVIYDEDTGEVLYNDEGDGSIQTHGRQKSTKQLPDYEKPDYDPFGDTYLDFDDEYDERTNLDRILEKDPNALKKVADVIEIEVGNSFPDGDPFDFIQPRLEKMYDLGPDPYILDILDAAVKEHLGAQSYHAYLANFWDDAASSDLGIDIDSDRNPWRESKDYSIKEALKDYDNQIEKAIASVLGVDEEQAKQVSRTMSFEDYMSFAMAVERNDMEEANEIVNSYVRNRLDVPSESIAQEMHYRIRQDEPNVIVPEFKMLNELKQREILSEMTNTELQKILANLKGYENPGMYERSLFDVHMVEEILRRTKNMKIHTLLELGTITPQQQQNPMNSQQKMKPRTSVSVKNDAGEAEDAEVVSDTGNQVTVRTKQGVKRMNKDQVTKKAVQEEYEELDWDDMDPNWLEEMAPRIVDLHNQGMNISQISHEYSLHPNDVREFLNMMGVITTNESDKELAEIVRLRDLAGIKK